MDFLRPDDFDPSKFYRVYFEKDIPIEFQFVKIEGQKIICRNRSGESFAFGSLDQYTYIKEVYPGWEPLKK